jgi:dihydrolipoamide dehydrogenase
VDELDVVVIGGGTGGYTAAVRATQLGLTAALVERDKVGGTCLHRGCIPTKVWLHSAQTLVRARNAPAFGVDITGDVGLNYASMRAHQQQVVDALHAGIRGAVQKHKIEIIEGQAQIASPTEVVVGDRHLRARNIVLATGSEPHDIPGLATDGDRILSSNHILEIEEPPSSIVIVGAGAIGCEFASFFADIGTAVTLVEMLPYCVPLEDPDAGRLLGKTFASRGVNVMTSAKVLTDRTRSYDGVVELTVEHDGAEKKVTGEKVLVAVGRQAVTDGLGLENTKVQLDGGWIQADGAYRTAEPNIYAVGDTIGGLLLAHVAGAEGFIAAEAIASAAGGQGQGPEKLDYTRVPRVTYSRPQVAAVGLTEAQAKEQGLNAKSTRFSLKYNAMALIHGETEGFAKVVYDRDSGDFLGATLVGEEVADLISEAALARFLQSSAWEVGANIHPHPTMSEALGEAAQLSAEISIYW